MRESFFCISLLTLPLFAAVAEPPAPARDLGDALVAESSAQLIRALPAHGRIHVEFDLLGPLTGNFSTDQVRLQLLAFLKDGDVSSFEIISQRQTPAFAQVSLLLQMKDRQARPRQRRLDLDYRKEESSWTLVAMRERAP